MLLLICQSLCCLIYISALGLGSQIGILEGMIGTLFDMPQLKGFNKPLMTGKLLIRSILTILKNLTIYLKFDIRIFKAIWACPDLSYT